MLKQSIWSVVSRRHTWRGTWPKRCSGWVRRECYGWCSQGKSSAWVWADTRSTLSPPAGKKRKESRVKNIPCLAVHADVKTLSNHHLTFLMTVTWPRYPAVPLSIKGISAARHILFTWFRAAGEDKQIEFPLTTNKKHLHTLRWKWENLHTSVIQSVHDQLKLPEEFGVVVWTRMNRETHVTHKTLMSLNTIFIKHLNFFSSHQLLTMFTLDISVHPEHDFSGFRKQCFNRWTHI